MWFIGKISCWIWTILPETRHELPSAVEDSTGKKASSLAFYWSKVPRENHVTSSFAPDLQHSDLHTRAGENTLDSLNLFHINALILLIDSEFVSLRMSVWLCVESLFLFTCSLYVINRVRQRGSKFQLIVSSAATCQMVEELLLCD